MKRTFLFALFLSSLLSACSNLPEVSLQTITRKIAPYRIDINQGNFVTQEMVVQLKLGQTREQVRFILGTPLVTDLFHADRWDYVYRFQPGQGEVQQRRFIVFFEDGKLVRVGGDVIANTKDAATVVESPKIRVIEIAPSEENSKKNETKDPEKKTDGK